MLDWYAKMYAKIGQKARRRANFDDNDFSCNEKKLSIAVYRRLNSLKEHNDTLSWIVVDRI